ncbi:DUF6206 family protein [Mycobacterium sp. ML4]
MVSDTLDARELDHLDARVELALWSWRAAELPVIGFGEITTVIAWPPADPRWAVKRLPRFSSRARLQAYQVEVDSYVAELRAAGVRVAHTEVLLSGEDERGVRAFMVQRLIPGDLMLTQRLRTADEAWAAKVFSALCRVVVGVVDNRLGLDAQVSNWAVDENDELELHDVSTPLRRDADGRDRLDAELVLGVYPALLRPALRRFSVPSILAAYHRPDTVLLDVGGNLHREKLGHLVPVLVSAAADNGVTLDEERARRRDITDGRMWRVLATLRRFHAGWQRRVRCGPCPTLLPPKEHHG